MIRINQIKLPIDHTRAQLEDKIKKLLKLKSDELNYQIFKRSIDARKKPELYYVYSVNVIVNNEEKLVNKLKNPSIILVKDRSYQIPKCGEEKLRDQPVIVGAGPAGLFCGLLLVEAGFRPILIERGKSIENRKADVEKFWETGVLDTSSNVQFGEGGAGTFSDGKLNTSVKDPSGRIRYVLEQFVRFGAKSDILYDNKPHIGTDVLSEVIVNMRKYLIEKGCDIRFETKMTDLLVENNSVKKVVCEDITFDTENVVLALGHSSRDTFVRLNELKIPMESKNFAVGFRVEHPQKMINECMYGSDKLKLPASPYKVTSNFPNGRGVYSFCMCPGGYVVNSSSEEGRTVVNGMSYSGRNGANANSAIIVSVDKNDFGSDNVLAGMNFQKKLEELTYKLGSGRIPQQLFGDYCGDIETKAYGDFASQTKGQTVFAKLNDLMSTDMRESFIQGMKHFGKIIPGFDRYDAIMSGMETRTSSPIRILRNLEFESDIKGLYPCGEGAGYAGGITSAAVDGIKVAESIIGKYRAD